MRERSLQRWVLGKCVHGVRFTTASPHCRNDDRRAGLAQDGRIYGGYDWIGARGISRLSSWCCC